MKKNILLISPMLHQGGFERICILTARELAKDYNVSIAVFSLEDLAFDISGLNVVNLNLPSKEGRINKIIQVFRRGWALTKLQKKLRTDVSYSFGITANIANAFSHGAKKKIVACHSFEEIKSSGYMKLIHNNSDVLLCCSKKMAKLVSEKYGFSRVRALWNPCDIERVAIEAEKPIDAFQDFFEDKMGSLLLTMGREDDVKGYWHLLKVFRAVKEAKPDVRLAIIGDGEFREYRELAAKLGIENSICFTGHKLNPFSYVKKASLFVMTSISEGLPNSLVEAMSLSIPIVSVNCQTGPAEILHDDLGEAEDKKEVFYAKYGILTPTLDADKRMKVEWNDSLERVVLEPAERSMADTIIHILNDSNILDRYAVGGLERAKDFSKESYVQNLELLFE